MKRLLILFVFLIFVCWQTNEKILSVSAKTTPPKILYDSTFACPVCESEEVYPNNAQLSIGNMNIWYRKADIYRQFALDSSINLISGICITCGNIYVCRRVKTDR